MRLAWATMSSRLAWMVVSFRLAWAVMSSRLVAIEQGPGYLKANINTGCGRAGVERSPSIGWV